MKPGKSPGVRALARVSYDHHQTTRWLAEDLRHRLPALEAEPWAGPAPARPPPPRYWFWKVPYPHNFVGTVTFEYYNNDHLDRSTFPNLLARHRVTEAWLAVLRYERAHGTPPATLADLVPDLLDAVPLDPFDGAPLRYDPDLRAIWSVGRKGTYRPTPTPPENQSLDVIELRLPAVPVGRED